eukprot:m.28149 g.28149  ORF g.28149 m.28149 type:complete len:69 (+) comp30580_c0_seq1:954-1160(+)
MAQRLTKIPVQENEKMREQSKGFLYLGVSTSLERKPTPRGLLQTFSIRQGLFNDAFVAAGEFNSEDSE